MTSKRTYHVVFALTLVALFALGTAWTAFIWRSMQVERTMSLERLEIAVLHAAADCGSSTASTPPAPRKESLVELVPAGSPAREGFIAPCSPFHPGLAVRPTTEAFDAIDHKLTLRRIQFHGESSTLLVLLAVCTVMLYRLVRTERVSAARMREFLATVTHEMKTPLTGIKSLLQTMAAGRIPSEDCPRLVGLGLKETERLEHMVDNILMSGRLRTSALQVHVEELRLKEQLEAFLDHRRRYMIGNEARLGLQWDAEGGDLEVRADANALRIVLENLTDNAFKYGGDKAPVTIVVTRSSDKAEVTVVDHGIGFAAHQAEALFTPFWRTSDGRSTQQHGTGLGLSLSLALARQMGGDLKAASEGPGQGARFTVSLPLVVR
jgi:signal transduction histidine kinase